MIHTLNSSSVTGAFAALAASLVLAACSGPSLPAEYTAADTAAVITPDYTDVTIPCNIAPMNFSIGAEGEEYVTHLYTAADPEGIVVGGRTVDIPADRWHALIGQAQGDTLVADIYVRGEGGWTRYPSVRNAVADSIDRYISYRLIEPSYIGFETMAICQRDLTSFDEKEIFNNQAMSLERDGQCINCHSYQDYNRDGNMQMHVRVRKGGTVISHNGRLKKVNLKTDSTVSAGVYPSWHPTEPLIAYSNNTTTQSFHTNDRNKVEVQDGKSDLILYDVEADRISIIANEPTELETFPYWHPDGKSLWYVSAKVPLFKDDDEISLYQNLHYKDYKYDLYRKAFDPETRTFAPADTMFVASALGKSVTLPRPSPDGRFVIFTLGEYGNFHIWHRDSDLFLLDLEEGVIRPLTEVNSPDVESYHSWSSNGRWIIFSSRRDDGSYTRLYIAYFDRDGKARKAFRLPQESPAHDIERMKSYNIPEFMVCPVEISKHQFIDAIDKDAVNVSM